MSDLHELSFSAQFDNQRKISEIWGATKEVVPRLPSVRQPATTIGHLLRGYLFPDVGDLNVATAENFNTQITFILRRKGILLEGARWLGGLEYYTWIRETLFQIPLPATFSREDPVTFAFTDLVPNGVDNIFATVEGFTKELFTLTDRPDAKWFVAADTPPGQHSAAHARYVDAWQSAFRALRKNELRPTAVHDLATGGVQVDFYADLSVTFEDRTLGSFIGEGRGWLLYIDGAWRLTGLHFPGFQLG